MSELLKVPFFAGLAIAILVERWVFNRKLMREHGLNAKQARSYVRRLIIGGDTKLLDGVIGWQLYFVPACWSSTLALLLLIFFNEKIGDWAYIVSYIFFAYAFANYVFLRVASKAYGSEGNILEFLSRTGTSYAGRFFLRLLINADKDIEPGWLYQLARYLFIVVIVFFPCFSAYLLVNAL